MADISIIARRLKNGNVEYGWSGNGGYYSSVGIRLLALYDNPADVDYLFGLGQTRLIGKKGSENGGFPAYLTHSPIGKEFWIGETEQDIFNEIMTDYTYFYDLDNEWYYITRGPFQIKIPLGLINNNLDENNDEFKYILTVGDKVLRYIMEEYRVTHPEFNDFIINEGYDWKTVVEDIIEDDKLLIMNLYSKYKAIYQYFDDWIVIKTDENYEDITEIIAKKKEKHHIETNVW